MNEFIRICLWLLCSAIVLDEALKMISEASTIDNIIGLLLCMLLVALSVKTKCFTNFKNKKNEKSN